MAALLIVAVGASLVRSKRLADCGGLPDCAEA